MLYKYKGKEYHPFTKDNVHIAGKLIYEGRTVGALLDQLEADKQIERQTITVYNLKYSDSYYNDDEIDLLLDDLFENEVISRGEYRG